MYYKSEEGVVYLENPESPTAVYSVEEWIIEKERLTIGLTKHIDNLQNQIDSQSQPIEILDSYSNEVKSLIEEHNINIESTEDLEIQKQEKQDLLNEILNL